MPASRLITSLALVAFALPVAACGDADKGLLSSSQAEDLLAEVDLAEKALDESNCQTVIRRAEDGRDLAQEQNGISTKLRNNIIEGFQRIADRAATECEPDKPEETATPTPTPTEEATETPTEEATEEPTATPTEAPTIEVTPEPTEAVPSPEATDDTGGVIVPDIEDSGR